MQATLDLCVSCKGCKPRKGPPGVGHGRMKIEVRPARQRRHGLSLLRADRYLAGVTQVSRPSLAPCDAYAKTALTALWPRDGRCWLQRTRTCRAGLDWFDAQEAISASVSISGTRERARGSCCSRHLPRPIRTRRMRAPRWNVWTAPATSDPPVSCAGRGGWCCGRTFLARHGDPGKNRSTAMLEGHPP